jgi:coatomer protein complex subunit alpha (xenin)
MALEDIALEILEAAGLTESDIDDIPDFGQANMKTPSIVTPTTNLVWPTVPAARVSSTVLSLMETWRLGLSLTPTVMPVLTSVALDDWAKDEEQDLAADEDGWDLDVGRGYRRR